MMDNFKTLLLQAPDTQLDSSVKELVKNWSEPATSLQVLEALDKTIYGSLGSGFTVKVLQMVLEEALIRENQTLESILPQAYWRK